MEFAGFELGEETKEVIVDDKKKLVLCPLGVLAVFFNGWREHGNQQLHDGLRRYCEYICMHGYRGGATKALAELDIFPLCQRRTRYAGLCFGLVRQAGRRITGDIRGFPGRKLPEKEYPGRTPRIDTAPNG